MMRTGVTNLRRRIILHGLNYPPELIGVGRYSGELAEYLAATGCDVEVVTAIPHYPGWRTQAPYRAYRYVREVMNGVRIIRCPLLLRENAGGVWRMLAPLSFALAATPVILWRILRKPPDTVLCIEPTLFSAPAALLAGKLVGAQCVLHVQDLEIDAAFAVGHLRANWLKRLALAIEHFVLRRFDTIVTISARMQERLAEKGVERRKMVVIKNWVDTDKIVPLGRASRFRDELGIQPETMVVLYAGHIGPKQALHLVLDAAAALALEKTIAFVIAGDGPLKKKFQLDYGNLPNIRFLPLQSEESLCELLNLADVHILPQQAGTADLVLPSKLAGMLASGRPVLAAVDPGTELYELLNGVSVIVPAGSTAAIVVAIRKLSLQDRTQLGQKSRELAQIFAKNRLLDQFRSLILSR